MRSIGRSIASATAAAIAASMLLASVAYAVPDSSAINAPVDSGTLTFRQKLENKQYRLEQLKARLDELDTQFSVAVESYDAAQADLVATQEQLAITESDLANAEAALATQQSLLETRVAEMYRTETYNPAGVLLASKSIPEFFSRLQFVNEIGTADAELAAQLKAQRDTIAGSEQDLKSKELQAKALEFTLRARKIEIEQRMVDGENMLKQAETDVLAMLKSEEARRAGIETALWKQILLGVSSTGVKVEVGSPVETALAYHGVPYVWGGASPRGFDCSGLTMYVMKQHGVNLIHHAADQINQGARVVPGDIKPGDLVFFGSPVHHVGMYIGGGYFVHAPRRNDYVKISKLAERSDFVGARRYPWKYRVGTPLGVSKPTLPSNLPVSR